MVFQFARDLYFRSDIYNRMLHRHGTPQLHGIASDPIPGDPVRGSQILNGDMVLAARLRHLGEHPFTAELKSRRAVADLHGFSWLRDLAALSAPAARDHAAALIRAWLRHFDRWDSQIWSPAVTGARVRAWINHIDFVTPSSDQALRAEIAASTAAQLRHLARADDGNRDAPTASAAPFSTGTALIAGAAAISDLGPLLDSGLSRLAAAIESDILADGGHRSRSPETAARALARLTEAQRILKTGRSTSPDVLRDAIARLGPAVKAMTLGDGGLAVFNGGTRGTPQEIAAILGAAGVRSTPPQSFPDWGFERLQAGTTTVIADTGGSERGNGHAGALSFEMSAGRHRLVVNCGTHPDETTDWSRVLRSTAAHSTLAVNDTDALPPPGTPGSDIRIAARRNERGGSSLVQMGHEGYRRAFGIVHNRDLYLSEAGDDFRGKDVLVGGAGAFTLRFHLHPDVGASLLEGGSDVLLKLPGGKGWRFRCAGARPALEESVYLGDPAAPRRCRQIVLRGDHAAGETAVRWSFLREGT